MLILTTAEQSYYTRRVKVMIFSKKVVDRLQQRVYNINIIKGRKQEQKCV